MLHTNQGNALNYHNYNTIPRSVNDADEPRPSAGTNNIILNNDEMKTFKRTSLVESIKYNGETYRYNAVITGGMNASGTRPEKAIEAVKSTGKKAVLVLVLQTSLKGVNDLRGNLHQARPNIYTNEEATVKSPVSNYYQNELNKLNFNGSQAAKIKLTDGDGKSTNTISLNSESAKILINFLTTNF